jgi:hypothetical protein
LLIASRVLARFPEALNPAARRILDTCHEDRSGERESYGMELQPMAVVALEMVRRLAAEKPDLASSVRELLAADEGRARRPASGLHGTPCPVDSAAKPPPVALLRA